VVDGASSMRNAFGDILEASAGAVRPGWSRCRFDAIFALQPRRFCIFRITAWFTSFFSARSIRKRHGALGTRSVLHRSFSVRDRLPVGCLSRYREMEG